MNKKTVISSPKSPVYRELRQILKQPIRSPYAIVEGYNSYNQLKDDGLPMEIFLEEGQEMIEGAKILSKRLFSNLITTQNPQGILCKVEKVKREFDNGMILLLDRVQDPGNVGTLLRSAQAFGINNILLLRGSCTVYNDKVLRSSMAAVFSLSIEEMASIERVEELLAGGYTLYSADGKGKNFKELKAGKIILALGNESRGISEEIQSLSAESYCIPMKGSQESLNVAVAGSIFMCQLQDLD